MKTAQYIGLTRKQALPLPRKTIFFDCLMVIPLEVIKIQKSLFIQEIVK